MMFKKPGAQKEKLENFSLWNGTVHCRVRPGTEFAKKLWWEQTLLFAFR